ncbi:MAG TPA: hypothetical protein VGP64_06465 [Polyangia bacterium]
MTTALRLTTRRVGVASVAMAGQTFEFDLRVVEASDGSYRWLTDTLSEPLPSLAAAVGEAETAMSDGGDVTAVVRWREDPPRLASGEHACPICHAPALDSARYPERICPACVLEATDTQGRPLAFANSSVGGGFEARYVDGGAPYAPHECFVRGVRCRAEEAHLAGIVVRPVAA